MSKPEKVVYYSDALHDDFAGTAISTAVIDGAYPYAHGRLWHFCSNLLYGVALPIVWFLHRVISGVKIVGRKKVARFPEACFLYGNHTAFFDAYTPAVLSAPRRADVLAGADAFSIRGLRTVVQMLGAIAVPNAPSGMKPFLAAVGESHERGRHIAIYPEAHIWPYYTGIRPFPASSLYYPAKQLAPVFAYCMTYQKGKLRKVRRTIYVSDPIYPDPSLPLKARQQKLRDAVFAYLTETAEKYSTYSYIRYEKKAE